MCWIQTRFSIIFPLRLSLKGLRTMADFLTSLKHGLDAAARVNREKAEIREVLNELNQQLKQGTGGKVEIAVHKFQGKASELPSILKLLTRESHMGLGLFHTAHKSLPPAKLAVWKQESSGYPCEIVFGGERISCADRAGLEKGLRMLLADPAVGGKITEFMSYKPKVTVTVAKKVVAKAATRGTEVKPVRSTPMKTAVSTGRIVASTGRVAAKAATQKVTAKKALPKKTKAVKATVYAAKKPTSARAKSVAGKR
jgi:hypothetical protein